MKTKPFSIELSDEAEIDFDNSYEFYYQDSPKVADAFFRRINLDFENIKQNPDSFPIAQKGVRKYVVKKFPFVIYYRIVDTTIQVIAIFHTSRNPEIWNERTSPYVGYSYPTNGNVGQEQFVGQECPTYNVRDR